MLEIVKDAHPCPFAKLHPSQLLHNDEFFMKLAFNQAIDAWEADEVPVGAVIAFGLLDAGGRNFVGQTHLRRWEYYRRHAHLVEPSVT